METASSWEDGPVGTTPMTLRNRGEPAGFANVAGADDGACDGARQPQGTESAHGHPRAAIEQRT
jgi:hypothetical protein